MNKTFIVHQQEIKDYVTGQFTDFGDPISIKEEVTKLLEGKISQIYVFPQTRIKS